MPGGIAAVFKVVEFVNGWLRISWPRKSWNETMDCSLFVTWKVSWVEKGFGNILISGITGLKTSNVKVVSVVLDQKVVSLVSVSENE